MKKVELTNITIEYIIEELGRIRSEKVQLDGIVMYYILKNLKMLEDSNSCYKSVRHDLILKYGVEKDGFVNISPEVGNWEEYIKELAPLNEDVTTFSIHSIKPEQLTGSNLSMDSIIALEFMIEE